MTAVEGIELGEVEVEVELELPLEPVGLLTGFTEEGAKFVSVIFVLDADAVRIEPPPQAMNDEDNETSTSSTNQRLRNIPPGGALSESSRWSGTAQLGRRPNARISIYRENLDSIGHHEGGGQDYGEAARYY